VFAEIAKTLISAFMPVIKQIIRTVLPPLMSLLMSILPIITKFVDALLPALLPLLDALMPILTMAADALSPLLNLFMQLVTPIIELIDVAIGPLLSILGQLVVMLVEELQPVFETVFAVATTVFNTFSEHIKIVVQAVQDVFRGIISFMQNIFAGDWEAAWEDVKGIFSTIWETIGATAKNIINGIIDLLNLLIRGLNTISIDIPDWDIFGELGGQTFGVNIPEIPHLAAGGIVTAPTLAQIGEGSEPEAVLPLSELTELLDTEPGGGAWQITFSPVQNFYGAVNKKDVEDANDASFDKFKRWMQQYERDQNRRVFARGEA
ncbi:MAG: hypothetical protein VB041_05215, partial [Candidatus Limiplasma sp.]|nr:hypothetical protein [Candidatus Limiplasma sp.]